MWKYKNNNISDRAMDKKGVKNQKISFIPLSFMETVYF